MTADRFLFVPLLILLARLSASQLVCPPGYGLFAGGCHRRILLKNLTERRDTSCPGSTLSFNCSIIPFDNTDRIAWHITYRGRETINITYSSFTTLYREHLDGAVVAILSKSEEGSVLESLLTVTMIENSPLERLVCNHTGFRVATADLSPYSIFRVPPAPANLRLTRETEINVISIEVEVEWQMSIPGQLYAVDNVGISISPAPISRQEKVGSPFVATLSRDVLYIITVTFSNCAGSNSSSLQITTFTATMALENQATGAVSSTDNILNTVANIGEPPPSFFCYIYIRSSEVTFSLNWRKMSATSLSGQSSQNPSANVAILTWDRPLQFLDTGTYLCDIDDSVRTSTLTLNLDVQYPATITSIYLDTRITSPSLYTFSVPSGYIGNLLICTGYGAPDPTIEWIRNGQVLDTRRINSNSETNGQPHFVSANLTLIEGFSSSDAGDYSCIIETRGRTVSQSRQLITLTKGSQVLPRVLTRCPPENGAVGTYFQIRVLNTNCFSWTNELRYNISRNAEAALISAISAECDECSLTTEVAITNGPVCSTRVENAAVFWGSITTTDTTLKTKIFCALMSWHRNVPIFTFLNGTFNPVDTSCPVEIATQNSSGCERIVPQSISSTSLVSIPNTASAMLALVLISVILGIVFLIYLNKKIKRTTIKRQSYQYDPTADPQTVYPDEFEEFQHVPAAIDEEVEYAQDFGFEYDQEIQDELSDVSASL